MEHHGFPVVGHDLSEAKTRAFVSGPAIPSSTPNGAIVSLDCDDAYRSARLPANSPRRSATPSEGTPIGGWIATARSTRNGPDAVRGPAACRPVSITGAQ